LSARFEASVILFSPEFLREGQALKDNLYPSRIIVGGPEEPSHLFSEILRSVADKPHVDVLVMSPSEAEAVKLFANTYLAMRVSFLTSWIVMRYRTT
jgi:UDPglucose 6-dehydrogenase|tara:strand:- start:434 stop:724 length:291 start_codon:yes stop_codon:yes gene_type:complete